MAGELFAVGDLQGCLESLKGLLEQLPKSAHIIFVGDIVNRGPQSLKTLRKVKKLCDSGRAEMVLGNHDLGFYMRHPRPAPFGGCRRCRARAPQGHDRGDS